MNPLGTPGGVVSPRNELAFDLRREAEQAKDADSPRFFKAAVLKTYFTPCADISGPGGAGGNGTKPSIRQLEAIFEVPRSTVGKWIAHHRHQADLFARSTLDQAVDLVQDDAISGDRSVFLRSEELKIVNYLVRSAFAHVALTKPDTIELFMRLSQAPRPDGKPRRQFGPNGPSESFLERFFAEFSDELRWITAHSIETIRTAAMNEETLRSFFERLQELCDKSGGKLWAEPGRIFNYDESEISASSKKEDKVVAGKGQTTVSGASARTKTMGRHITGLFTVAADGTTLPPSFVLAHPGKTIPPAMIANLGRETNIYHNESGYIDAEMFADWFQLFVKQARAKYSDGPILLILDGASSHKFTTELVTLADENDIDILILPAHTSTKLQPLDATVLGWFKKQLPGAIRAILRKCKKSNDTNTRLRAACNVWTLLTEGKDCSKTIRGGFSRTGICPLDPTLYPSWIVPTLANGLATLPTPSLNCPRVPSSVEPVENRGLARQILQLARETIMREQTGLSPAETEILLDAFLSDVRALLQNPALTAFEELLRAPPLTPSSSCTEPATVRTVKPNKAYSPQDAAQRATQHEREAREQEKAQVAPLMAEYNRAMRTYEDEIEPVMNQQDQLKSTIDADQARLAELEADDSAAALVADARAQLHANQQRLAKVNATVKQMVAAKPKRPDVRHVRALAASKTAAAAPALQSVATMAVEQDDSDDECEEDGIPPSPMQVTSAAPARFRKRIYERDSDDEAAPSFETAQSGGSDENVTYSLSSRSLERLKEPRLATRSSSRLILSPGVTLSRANTSGVSSWLTNDMAAMQLVSTEENVSSTPKTDRRKRLALSDLSNSN
uniref:Transposase n=1 Tax=Capsaspora owczarzaki TaxID=192875 RepID=W4P298_9EUKA|nr:TPA: transposase [Capsaspora owczarzaki]